MLGVRGKKELAILSAGSVTNDGHSDCPIDRGDTGCLVPMIGSSVTNWGPDNQGHLNLGRA